MFGIDGKVTVRLSTKPVKLGGLKVPPEFQGKVAYGKVKFGPSRLVQYVGKTLGWFRLEIVAGGVTLPPLDGVRYFFEDGNEFASLDPVDEHVFVIDDKDD